jgi:predicted acetyltransferase
VTGVGVLPTHRRRGVLNALMRRQLDDIREGGEPIAALWASEGSIYGRFGYGVATLTGGFDIERSRTAFVEPHTPAGTFRLVDKAEALQKMPAPYEHVRLEQPGMIDRPQAWWQARFADVERFRDEYEKLFYVVYERDGEVPAYAAYRIKHSWEQGSPASVLAVEELVSTDTESYASIWTYLFGVDLMARIEGYTRPADEPLLLMLAEPRRLNFHLRDGAYVRLVDVRRALAGRRYRSPGTLTLEVADGFCPWNSGRYELDGGPDGATCRKGRRRPDVRLGVRELGSVYLGGVTFSQLARAGRIDASPETVLKADAMFGWDRAPWCPHIF